MSNVVELYADTRPCDSEASDMGIISSRADIDYRDRIFIRSMKEGRSSWMELEPTKAIEPLWKTAVAAALFAIAFGAVVAFL